MRESEAYFDILDEGREKQVKEDILLAGEVRFGPADESVKTALAGVNDLDRLRAMFRRALKASSWREILDTP
jgi:hypothetical protein